MATAVVSNTKIAVTQTALDLAKGEYEKALSEYQKAGSVVHQYASRTAELEREIDQLTSRYDSECVSAAGGSGVDPGPTLTQLQRAKSLLHGCGLARAKAEADSEPLRATYTAAVRKLREAQWGVEEERLTRAVVEAEAGSLKARQDEVAAMEVLSRAVRARDSFRRQIERERKESF